LRRRGRHGYHRSGGQGLGARQGRGHRDQFELRGRHERARRSPLLGGELPRLPGSPHHTFESGNDAFWRSIQSRSSSSTASSFGGGSYSASVFFHTAFARVAASGEPSDS